MIHLAGVCIAFLILYIHEIGANTLQLILIILVQVVFGMACYHSK